MRPSLFSFAGGADAMSRLVSAHHQRCLADDALNHPFTGPGLHPEHLSRLAAYLGEVLGGPRTFSQAYGSHATMLHMHAGNGDMTDIGARFAQCFVLAMDDAELPEDPAFRAAMAAYMDWAVLDVLGHGEHADINDASDMPSWGWDGLRT